MARAGPLQRPGAALGQALLPWPGLPRDFAALIQVHGLLGRSDPKLTAQSYSRSKNSLGAAVRKPLGELERVMGIEPTTFSLGS